MLLRFCHSCRIFFIFLIPLIFIAGCSSGNKSPISPITADEKTSTSDQTIISPVDLPIDEMDPNEPGRQLVGSWQMNFDPQSQKLALTQNRDLAAHYYIHYLVDVDFSFQSYDSVTGLLVVDASITNPFLFSGYDVRIIVFSDLYGERLLNPDDWTELWDPYGGVKMNPFKAFAKNEPNREFSASAQHTENLQLHFPAGCNTAIFEIDASYPDNCEEPYMIDNFQHGTIYSYPTSSTTAEVEVYDWQDDVTSVSLGCQNITGQSWVDFTNVDPNAWELNLVNSEDAQQGNYVGTIKATSANSTLYDVIEITITETPPDNDPPEWDTTTGITHAIPFDGSIMIRWGRATDLYNPPVEYLLYMDDFDDNVWVNDPLVIDENDPHFQSRHYTYTGLDNGSTYYFGVRARDSADPQNTESNTVVLDATPDVSATLITSLNFYPKPPEDTWWDVCVQPDSYVYVCADHYITGNTNGDCDTGLRTALKFNNDLSNMTVLNELDGMAAPTPGARTWLTDWQRIDVSDGGNLVTSQCGAGIATWTVSGSIAINESCCWAWACGAGPSPVPDVADHISLGYDVGMVGFGITFSGCVPPEDNWSMGFADKDLPTFSGYNWSGKSDYPPTDFLTYMVGLEGMDNTDNVMIFYSSPTVGKISIWGDAYSSNGSASELDYTGDIGTGPGEFSGGLDFSIDSEGNIVTLEDHGGGVFRFQKFAPNFTLLYQHIWDGTDAPMRIDFDKGDDTLYMLTDDGVHILSVS